MKTTTLSTHLPKRLLLIPLFACSLLISAQAVSPPPDGGYPGGNTAEGQNALLSLTSGAYNTAVGFASLKKNTVGGLNTAVGVNALSLNTTGVNNTANGGNALYSNTTGDQNTANGVYTLFQNTTGVLNTAMGAFALGRNTTGSANTAVGQSALLYSTGSHNTAVGVLALNANFTGDSNTAVGREALFQTGGSNSNTAVGAGALHAPGGDFNTALGVNAGNGLAGFNNTALGAGAGSSDTGGSNNIYIGAGVVAGALQESNTIRIGDNLSPDPGASACFIGGINGQTTTSGTAVFINSSGKLGTITSSARFKKDIKPMDSASEVILSLRPVTFHYRSDTMNTPQFGLVAEEVARMDPALVLTDKEGKPYTVRYEQVNAMLLNEFLKEHRKVEELEANATRQQKQIDALTAGLQRVSAQLEASKMPQVVLNDR
jgi:hypothetical protein